MYIDAYREMHTRLVYVYRFTGGQIHRLSCATEDTRRLNPDGDSRAVCAGYSRVYVYLRKHVRVDIKERVCLQTNRI